MDDSIPLLDTPKRKTIQSQADALRASLKDFERNFAAANNGRKPGKEDIKADATIAAKYKEYNKVRDVLAGKLSLDTLYAPPAPPPHQSRRRHTRTDSAISLTPRRPRNGNGTKGTPSKARLHPNEIDPYDAPPASASPKVILSAIGPTPRRDGTVLGIFDLLPRSGSTVKTTISQDTPASRKRKIDALVEAQDENRNPNSNLPVAQTPSHRRRSSRTMDGGAEEPLPTTTTTPRSCLNTGRRLQHSKTPVSEGKKFMLNHFFATPSAVRFATMMHDDTEEPDHDVELHAEGTPAKTPLRDTVLGLSPSSKHDATPPYLKRSFSFKERLLSASASADSATVSSSSLKHAVTSPTASRAGPRTLRQAKFGPKPLSQMIAELQNQNENQTQTQSAEQVYHDDQEDEESLEALRELESNEVNVLIGDSQVGGNGNHADHSLNLEPVRTYKKKGQKRTTRRVIMRPVRMKPAAAPKFVAAADDDEDDDDEENEDPLLALSSERGDHRNGNDVSRVAETQVISADVSQSEPVSAEDHDFDYLISQAEQDGGDYIDTEDEYLPEQREGGGEDLDEDASATPRRKGSSSTIGKAKTTAKGKKVSSNSSNKKGNADADGQAGTTRTIDPNAYSHMNFRSLKIKNKNSKAKGRGRFGRGRG
ncbi:DNA replication regulator sld2 [Exophiala dermatitidis]